MTTKSLITKRNWFWLAVASCLCASVTACGSGNSTGASSGGGTGNASTHATSAAKVEWTATPAGYIAAGGTALPSAYPTPAKSPGKGCKIGYVSASNAIPAISAEISGITKAAARFGCTVVTEDGQLNPQAQVTGMQSLLGQGVLAIIVDPLVAVALTKPIQQANEQHVPVIAVDSPTSPDGTNIPGTTSDFLQSRDVTAFAAVKAVADAKPGAQIGLLYPAFPAGNLQYQVTRFRYWAGKLGLKVVAQSDSSGDTPGADSQAANSLLQQHPQIQAVLTYNDTAAAATATAARSLGRNDVLVTGIDGEQGATDLIAAGRVLMTWAYNNVLMGEQEGTAAIDAADNVTIPAKVTALGAIINKGNVAAYHPQG